MAATDQTYRSQRGLDVVFGVSSLLMLVSIILMFAQDYYRPWKTEQRAFMKVESVMAERDAFDQVLTVADRYDEAMLKVVTELDNRKKKLEEIEKLDKEIKALTPEKEKQDKVTANVKSELASRQSFYNIAVEKEGPKSTTAENYLKDVEKLTKELA